MIRSNFLSSLSKDPAGNSTSPLSFHAIEHDTHIEVPLSEYVSKLEQRLGGAQATHEAHVLSIVSDYRSVLKELKQDLKAEVNVVRYELSVARSEFKNEMSSMKFDFKELRTENTQQNADHRKATDSALQTLKVDISGTLKKSLTDEITEQNTALKLKTSELEGRLKEEHKEFYTELEKASANEKTQLVALKEDIVSVRDYFKEESDKLKEELAKLKDSNKAEATELKAFVAAARVEQKNEMLTAIQSSYYRLLVGVFTATAGGIGFFQAGTWLWLQAAERAAV